MHEQDRQPSTPQSSKGNANPLRWFRFFQTHQHHTSERESNHKEEPKKPKYRATKAWWKKLCRAGPSKHVELILAGMIGAFACGQWITSCKSGDENSAQTKQLIAAASISAYASQQNVQASRNFAESARSINEGVSNAVTKLQVQANAIEASRESSQEAASKSLQANVDNFYREQRAWVALTPAVTGPLRFDSFGVSVPLDIEMRNVGHSPAQYVKLWEKLVVTPAAPNTDQMESTCSLLKKSPTSEEKNGWSLFPTQVGREPYPAFAPRKDIDAALINNPFPSGKVGLYLILCADYTLTFDPKVHHQTRQGYGIYWLDQTRGGVAMGIYDPNSFAPVPIVLDLLIGGTAD